MPYGAMVIWGIAIWHHNMVQWSLKSYKFMHLFRLVASTNFVVLEGALEYSLSQSAHV